MGEVVCIWWRCGDVWVLLRGLGQLKRKG